MQDDYYSVLARMIAATMQDESQLRRMVFELARQKLRRQIYLQYISICAARRWKTS